MITLVKPNRYVLEIKKSRFIAKAVRVDSRAEALSKLADLSEVRATHNCWAFRVADDYRFSDNGEPGGTAGRPILSAIDKQGFDHVLVMVTRYFGGIKLGAGGLVRAYTAAASECLRSGEREEFKIKIRVEIQLPFEAVAQTHALLEEFGAAKLKETYGPEGVLLTLQLEPCRLAGLEERLAGYSHGKCSVRVITENEAPS